MIFNNFHPNFLPRYNLNLIINYLIKLKMMVLKYLDGQEMKPEYIKKSKGYKKTKFLNRNIICIPIHEFGENKDIDRLIKIISEYDR